MKKGSLPGLQTATFSLCPHMTFLCCTYWKSEGDRERGREREISSSCHKVTNPILRDTTSWLNLTLFTSQRPHLQKPSHRELGLQLQSLGGVDTYSITGTPLNFVLGWVLTHTPLTLAWQMVMKNYALSLFTLKHSLKRETFSSFISVLQLKHRATYILHRYIHTPQWINMISWK